MSAGLSGPVSFSEEGSGFCRTHIILSKMNTFCSDSHCNIDSVIYEQGNVIGTGDLMQLFGCFYQNTRVAGLVSILDDCNA